MRLRAISVSILLSTSSLCAGRASAQPVPVPILPAGGVITSALAEQTTGGQVSWDDSNRHIKVAAVYNGRNVKVLGVTLGEGPARSYLSQRSDIVVLVLSDARARLRQFNLPDPLEVRVRERPPARPIGGRPTDGTPPTVGIPDESPRIPGPDRDAPGESKMQRRSVQFEIFIPRLEGARWVEFRAGEPNGRLLGRADLSGVR
jgi:hypothetical protein